MAIFKVAHGYFHKKWGLCGHLSSTRGSYTSPHICFLAIDHILGFLVETISWSKSLGVRLRYYLKWLFMIIFVKEGGLVAIDLRPKAIKLNTTNVSFQKLPFLNLWWRPFLGQKSICVSL